MEPIAKISALLSTTRELNIDAAQASLARTVNSRTESRDLKYEEVKRLLESKNDREILDGLRSIIIMIYKQQPCIQFFALVVKTVANENLEVKKLVFIYLLRYAEDDPDLALLSVNTIQKSLSDARPQARVLALRAMCGMRVPIISQIVSLGIQRASGDMDPRVRKAAALSIPKCVRLDPSTLPQMIDVTVLLLSDKQYYVAGPAAAAFNEICPDRIDELHTIYRDLVRKIVNMDEWSQMAAVNLLTLYCLRCFPANDLRSQECKLQDEQQDVSPLLDTAKDPDLTLFLGACKSMLHSRNAAVVAAITRAFMHLGKAEDIKYLAGPLVALLRRSTEIRELALINIAVVCTTHAEPFAKHHARFLIRKDDGSRLALIKIEILLLIYPYCSRIIQEIIATELNHFSKVEDCEIRQASVKALGQCAIAEAGKADICLRFLLRQINSGNENLYANAVTTVRHVVQHRPKDNISTIKHLTQLLPNLANKDTRAEIIWLVGEFAPLTAQEELAPQVLSTLLEGFENESELGKLAILSLCAKIYVQQLLDESALKADGKVGLDETAKTSKDGPVAAHASASVTSAIESTQNESSRDSEVDRETRIDEKDAKVSKSSETNRVGETSQQETSDQCSQESRKGSEADMPVPDRAPASRPPPRLRDAIALSWRYITAACSEDESQDLRERSAFYAHLLAPGADVQFAREFILYPKPPPKLDSFAESRHALLTGSCALALGSKDILDYHPLPDRIKSGEEPDHALRNPQSRVAQMTRAAEDLHLTSRTSHQPAAKSSNTRDHTEKQPLGSEIDYDKDAQSKRIVAPDLTTHPPEGSTASQSNQQAFEDWLNESEGSHDDDGAFSSQKMKEEAKSQGSDKNESPAHELVDHDFAAQSEEFPNSTLAWRSDSRDGDDNQ